MVYGDYVIDHGEIVCYMETTYWTWLSQNVWIKYVCCLI